jgi:hypothetical protein
MDFNNLCIYILWVLMHLLNGFGIHLHLLVISCLIKFDQLKCLTAMQPLAFHYKALHVVIVSSLVEYDMCSCLLFIIASTPSGCYSDGQFEDFPRGLDDF